MSSNENMISSFPFEFIKNYIPVQNHLKLQVQGEFGIVNSSCYLTPIFLNDVALYMYNLMDGKNTIEDIFNVISKEYDVSDDELKGDLTDLVRDLQWKNIITIKK